MAEALLNLRGAGRFKAYSAGSRPKGEVHPLALDVLRRNHLPVEQLRSKSWEEFAAADAPRIDFVFTVCDRAATEVCPIWPGQPMTAHWGIPDPAAAAGTEPEIALTFNDAYRMLNRRIEIFAALPIKSLDSMTLKGRLKEIGRMSGGTAKARDQ
jgi:arsenate reductase